MKKITVFFTHCIGNNDDDVDENKRTRNLVDVHGQWMIIMVTMMILMIAMMMMRMIMIMRTREQEILLMSTASG